LDALDPPDDDYVFTPPKSVAMTRALYNPLHTLRPYSWSFQVSPNSYDNEALTLTTTGQDAIGRHVYALNAQMSAQDGLTMASLVYQYNGLPVDVQMSASWSLGPHGGYRYGNAPSTWTGEEIDVGSDISIPLDRAFIGESLQFGHHIAYLRPFPDFPSGTLHPFDLPTQYPATGFLSVVGARWNWSNARGYHWSVGAEKGTSVWLQAELAAPEIGSQYSATIFTGGFNHYFGLGARHVIAVHGEGGISLGSHYGGIGYFGVGGFNAPSLVDAFRYYLIQSGIALRGFPINDRVGSNYVLTNTEYRFPLLDIDRGVSTLPVFLQRIYGDLFCDVGDATNEVDLRHMRVGVGGEMLVDFVAAYTLPFTLRVGVARGVGPEGQWQTYALLAPFF
jgi:hypothetical protein